ncbi:Soluble aldose sugar dehydrogenase yliI precursor [Sphingobacterium spiritivorum]|uniref:Soluble aldose sugar dehydrogenase yliI n=1 Tax=Sphingobacterium spiritivorum TaxID=258 RepID=A0A380CPF7_SPHSI|nr:PQQ-dependent sugar dehydrogenase [Sphingobacterium spiritivorum]SUJ25713.1 Soluble aldose sugar dehydrogenase yliI precursor [Sphingobacterium spiritivorum]
MLRFNTFIIVAASVFMASCGPKKLPENAEFVQLQQTVLSLTQEADSLNVPWDLQYDQTAHAIIFSEIAGKIKKLDLKTSKVENLITIPEVYHQRTLGLLGMALFQKKDFPSYLYLSYTSKSNDSIFSNLVRYDYSTTSKLSNPKTLLKIPGNTGHNGSRIIVTHDQKIIWATGDAASDTYAQDSTSLNGKILRLNPDGSIPKDNPIPGSYVYAWGFRNMQGLTQSTAGNIYTSEHGDAIEDEINLIRPLHNYGWPQIEGMHDTETEKAIATKSPRTEPIRSWTPVIAPAGLAYYGNDAIPEWKNTLLLTTLKSQSLRILKLSDDGSRIIDEDILFADKLGRLRSVLVAPDGDIYFCSSNRDWNPQKGFPKPADDVIYKLSKTDVRPQKTIRPAKPVVQTTKSGQELYKAYCASCHKDDGSGVPSSFPPLKQSALVNGAPEPLIHILLKGLTNQKIGKVEYEGAMPAFSFLKDEEIASIATYIRSNFNNQASAISATQVKSTR